MPARRAVRRRLPVQLPPTRIEEEYAAAIIRAVVTVMHWAYAPLLEEAPKLAQQRLEAKRAHADAFNPDEPRDEDGRWSGEGGSPTEVRRSYTVAGQLVSGTTDPGFKLLQGLKREGHVYRGMTEAEYRNTVGVGRGVHSTNVYSASTEGTNFAADPDSAESYVNGGRDLPVKTGRPTYLVEAKGTGLTYNRAADAWQTPVGQGLPHDQVTRVWKMEKDGDSVTLRRIPVPVARHDAFNPDEPRDENGKWTAEGDYAKGVVESTGSVPPKVRNEPAPLERSEYWAAMDAVGGQFTEDEREALSNWTSSSYKWINRAAREGHPDTQPAIRKLDSAIAKSEAPRDMLVYRGFDESRMFGFKPGDVFSDNGFIATSARWDVARSFASSSGGEHGNAGAVVKIIVPKGAPALPVVGQAGDEGEVLLPRGSHFKVLQVVHSGSGEEDQLDVTAQLLEPGHHDSVDSEHVVALSSDDEQRFVWRASDLILKGHGARFDSFESRRVAQLIREAARRMRMHLNKRQIAALAKKFAERTNTHQRIQLGRQLHEVMAIDVPLSSAFAANRIADFVRENVALISSIPQEFHPHIETMVHHAVTSGRLADDLSEDIADLFNVADRRARFIARDQIGKLTADLNHQRQRDLGIERFVWRTMQDERVRGNPSGLYPDALPSHYELNGKMFSYADPPTPPGADGPLLPGEDYNCRCYAEPVIDDLIDDADVGDPSILAELGEDLDD